MRARAAVAVLGVVIVFLAAVTFVTLAGEVIFHTKRGLVSVSKGVCIFKNAPSHELSVPTGDFGGQFGTHVGETGGGLYFLLPATNGQRVGGIKGGFVHLHFAEVHSFGISSNPASKTQDSGLATPWISQPDMYFGDLVGLARPENTGSINALNKNPRPFNRANRLLASANLEPSNNNQAVGEQTQQRISQSQMEWRLWWREFWIAVGGCVSFACGAAIFVLEGEKRAIWRFAGPPLLAGGMALALFALPLAYALFL